MSSRNGTFLGDDVGEVGVEDLPTIDWLCEDANEADDKATSMLASMDPEVDSARSPGEVPQGGIASVRAGRGRLWFLRCYIVRAAGVRFRYPICV